MTEMSRQEYLKEVAKTKRGQMKLKLWNWGGALDLCRRKHEEIRKMNRMLDDAKRLAQAVPITEEVQKEYNIAFEKIVMQYQQEIKNIQATIEEVLTKKNSMDKMIARLDTEEQEFLHLRYEKGYGYDYISLKIHMSRAQCFRLNEKALEKLVDMEEGFLEE